MAIIHYLSMLQSANYKRKSTLFITLVTAVILLVPLIAMQFTNEVNWAVSDFIIAAILLLGTGFSMAYAVRKIKRKSYRLVVVLLLLFFLMLVWAEMAVGIFGSPMAGS
jgi:hypothetical protein